MSHSRSSSPVSGTCDSFQSDISNGPIQCGRGDWQHVRSIQLFEDYFLVHVPFSFFSRVSKKNFFYIPTQICGLWNFFFLKKPGTWVPNYPRSPLVFLQQFRCTSAIFRSHREGSILRCPRRLIRLLFFFFFLFYEFSNKIFDCLNISKF